MKLNKRHGVVAAGAVVAIIVLAALLGAFSNPYENLEFVEVTEGEFVKDVVVRGELLSERSRSVTVPAVRGRTQIVWLVEDGVHVEAGDVVARLDMTDLQNQREQREQQLELEQGNLESFLASKPNQIRSAESSLQTAQYDLELAKIRLDLSEFESAQEQESRRLAYENAMIRVDNAQRSLESTKSKLEVDEMRQRTRIRQAQQRLDEVNEQLEAATLRAPIAGIIVHGEMYDGPTAGTRKIRVGDDAHRGQTVVTIPDLSEMLVNIRIAEGDYSKIKVDQPVELRLDAIQGPVFPGHVEEIATLASFDRMINASYFSGRVRLDSVDTGMRPGMTASLRIITGREEGALYIPNTAVFDVEGRTVVFPRKTLPEPQEVVLGDRNLDSVIVLEGLEAGEEICLRDPRELTKSASPASPVPGASTPAGQKSRSPSPAPTQPTRRPPGG